MKTGHNERFHEHFKIEHATDLTLEIFSSTRCITSICMVPVCLKDQFLLHPEITFLNFGSFGACPRPVFEAYQRWQLELEKEPIQFMLYRGPEQLRKSREALANYVGCNGDDLVFTTNPSYAVNIVAKSLRLAPGDEILTTDLEYGAMDRTWAHYSALNGYVYKRQPIRLPLKFWQGLTKSTKAIFISHITSSTALIFPVEKICRRAKELGLLTIVDGAHVPGHIHLDITRLNADVYTGACHKWMMAPKGCSFLYASPQVQQWLDPLVVSWGYDNPNFVVSKFQDYHQQQGTRDYSAFLVIPECISFMEKYDWKTKASACRQLVISQTPRFAELLNTEPHAPLDATFFGQMSSLEIQTKEPENIKKILYDQHQIEIPVMPHGDKVFIRFSLNAFNDVEDLDRLYIALEKLQKTGKIRTK
jgi:isopenicillin-N epimerase